MDNEMDVNGVLSSISIYALTLKKTISDGESLNESEEQKLRKALDMVEDVFLTKG